MDRNPREGRKISKEFEDMEKGETAAVPTKNESRPLLNIRNTSLSAPTGMGAVDSTLGYLLLMFICLLNCFMNLGSPGLGSG